MFFLLACVSEAHLIRQLDAEVIAQQQRVRMLEERLANCDQVGTADKIFPELVAVMGGQRAVVSRQGAYTLVSFSTDDLFSSGATLRDEAAPMLDLVAMALTLHPDRRVEILVYTDDQPVERSLRKQFPSPWELTSARAAALVRTMIELHKVPASMLTAAARGDQDPLGSNDTPEGRALNRRLIFRISPEAPA
jgi:chemotaxis protein MotB